MKLLIIGHARHGKDTVAEMLSKNFGLTSKASSMAASEIFIYDLLKEKYGYKTPEECFEDRVNHRAEWYDLIVEYNSEDRTRLASKILERYDIYTGMRNSIEIEKCQEKGLFDFVIGVYDGRKPHEPKDSFNIDLWEAADFVIPNGGTLEQLEDKVGKLFTEILS